MVKHAVAPMNEPDATLRLDRELYVGFPADVAAVLEELRSLMGDWRIDDPEDGLAFQYRNGLVDLFALTDLRAGQHRLLDLLDMSCSNS